MLGIIIIAVQLFAAWQCHQNIKQAIEENDASLLSDYCYIFMGAILFCTWFVMATHPSKFF